VLGKGLVFDPAEILRCAQDFGARLLLGSRRVSASTSAICLLTSALCSAFFVLIVLVEHEAADVVGELA
jgi:hypothetical protein